MTRPRIHLIFDYVDNHPIRRCSLQPGDLIYQTRRSLDLASDFGSQKCPNYIIIGAQKCGTTSLYEYISQHGLALKGLHGKLLAVMFVNKLIHLLQGLEE